MPRKVIIDCDPGIDDALALTLALFDPRLEVVAVNAVAGNVPAERATLNVQAIVEQLDPPRYPRLGAATAADDVPYTDGRLLHGPDGLGGAGLAVSKLARQHLAEKLISDEVRAAPGDVTIICLGPLTNVARALVREPELADLISRIVIRGGAVNGIGDVTPCTNPTSMPTRAPLAPSSNRRSPRRWFRSTLRTRSFGPRSARKAAGRFQSGRSTCFVPHCPISSVRTVSSWVWRAFACPMPLAFVPCCTPSCFIPRSWPAMSKRAVKSRQGSPFSTVVPIHRTGPKWRSLSKLMRPPSPTASSVA